VSADAAHQTLLAFDWGARRVGVAVGNTLTRSARPLEVIETADEARRFARIGRLLADWRPDRLVVGVPREPGVEVVERVTVRCERFARQLEGRFQLPVETVDERFSSRAAASELRRDGVADDPDDAAAAALILEQWFHDGR
jgi:putative Holliday junction resolvase